MNEVYNVAASGDESRLPADYITSQLFNDVPNKRSQLLPLQPQSDLCVRWCGPTACIPWKS